MKLDVRYIVRWDKVRSGCISHNWYTRGNNDEYKNMLLATCRAHTLEAIYNIAQDIHEHSDIESTENKKWSVKHIMNYILNECAYIVVE